MKKLSVYIEINGIRTYVGKITGDSVNSAVFTYSKDYLDRASAAAISLSLPLSERSFDPVRTRIFFDGLLPEGFMRRSVSAYMNLDPEDYLSLLGVLGKECLGAIQIINDEEDAVSIDDGLKDNEKIYDSSKPGYRLLSKEEVKRIAEEGTSETSQLIAGSRLSLTGASGKAGLYYDEGNEDWYQPVGTAPSTHIVKQSHVRLAGIVTNERLCLMTASACGIAVPESFIINTENAADKDVLFATKRYDRIFPEKTKTINGLPIPQRLHQEDFCQALSIPADNKYEYPGGDYLKKVCDLIRFNSASPVNDILKIWDKILFDYFIGNADNHIKNIALLYEPDLKKISVAPIYDLVSTVIYENTRNMGISINNKVDINKIGRADFADEAEHIGISRALALKHFDNMAERFESALINSASILENEGFKEAANIKDQILNERRKAL